MSPIRVNLKQTKVNVNAIQSHFRPGGAVHRDATQTGRAVRRTAERIAPSRTGMAGLKGKHTGPSVSTIAFQNHVTVGNKADYARFVHEGTRARIFPHNRTGFLWVRPQPHSWYAPNWDPFGDGIDINAGGRTPRRSVRGQKKNQWLVRAMKTQMGRRGYLR
jgi:hypothetical protein